MLFNKLPTTVIIGGVEYAINADFRTSILFSIMLEDEELEESEKIFNILNLYYPILPPSDYLNEAIDKIMWFYKCGEEIKESTNNKVTSNKKIYSFEYDEKVIYSGFYEQYRLDLDKEGELHWWKFKTLFDGLNDNTKIKKIMLYRSIDLKDIKDEGQKEFYKEMKEIFKLPTVITEKENIALDETTRMLMQYQ